MLHSWEEIEAYEYPDRRSRKIKKQYWSEVANSFDIETSSFYDHGQKRAVMYLWSFAVEDDVFIGRSWEEAEAFFQFLRLKSEDTIVIYVHNLAFEFQFIRFHLPIDKVFAVSNREPLFFRSGNLEFRCSYQLSGKSLDMLGREVGVRKMMGDLDYRLNRFSDTVLTAKELNYSAHDVLVVTAYIRKLMKERGSIAKIPYTKTGFVRDGCRKHCLSRYNFTPYRRCVGAITIADEAEYKQLKRAFQGGFTHANAHQVGRVIRDVQSMDFTSSYPAVMVLERFPMGPARFADPQSRAELDRLLNNYCCMMDLKIYGLQSKTEIDHPLSRSKCSDIVGMVLDNGRIVSADELITTVTDVDFRILQDFYTWDSFQIGEFRYYPKGYLPRPFLQYVLKLYAAKTTLKGVAGREAEYALNKAMLNALYGMCVTDIVRPEYVYQDDCWAEFEPSYETELTKYNKTVKRFLAYQWGVWVTAYARRNLFTALLNLGSDYIYSDTDSVKYLHPEAHQDYFDRYNRWIRLKIAQSAKVNCLSPELYEPKTIKGKVKTIGVWDFDGRYSAFKTLGAKRYLTRSNGRNTVTVAGLPKATTREYLAKTYGSIGTFEAFTTALEIPAKETGKLTLTYIDHETEGEYPDYTGKVCHYHEKSGVHMEPAPYSLSMNPLYLAYLEGLKVNIE